MDAVILVMTVLEPSEPDDGCPASLKSNFILLSGAEAEAPETVFSQAFGDFALGSRCVCDTGCDVVANCDVSSLSVVLLSS